MAKDQNFESEHKLILRNLLTAQKSLGLSLISMRNAGLKLSNQAASPFKISITSFGSYGIGSLLRIDSGMMNFTRNSLRIGPDRPKSSFQIKRPSIFKFCFKGNLSFIKSPTKSSGMRFCLPPDRTVKMRSRAG